MKPQMQTKFEQGSGDCVAACVASILEMNLEDVPNFAASKYEWVSICEAWLNERGYTLISIGFDDITHLDRAWITPGQHVILSGLSPRAEWDKNFRHAVVGLTIGRGIEIVHDPHPDGDGILEASGVMVWLRFIVPRNNASDGDGAVAPNEGDATPVIHATPELLLALDELIAWAQFGIEEGIIEEPWCEKMKRHVAVCQAALAELSNAPYTSQK